MKLVSELVAPKGYTVYAGADITGGIDASGKIVWACTCQKGSEQTQVIFIGARGEFGILELKDNNGQALINARGSLSFPASKAYYVGWTKRNEKSPKAFLYEVDEIRSIVINGSTSEPSIMNCVDSGARTMAQNASSKATEAYNKAASVESKLGNSTNAEKTLSDFFVALDRGDRSNPTFAFGQDVLYQKVKDWK